MIDLKTLNAKLKAACKISNQDFGKWQPVNTKLYNKYSHRACISLIRMISAGYVTPDEYNIQLTQLLPDVRDENIFKPLHDGVNPSLEDLYQSLVSKL